MSTLAKKPIFEVIQDKLPDVRLALPPGTIEAERLEVAFRSAFNKNPRLLECTQMSICASLVNCATLGLVPNTPEQHAYLVPRNVKHGDGWRLECNLEIGYRGFVHMILRGGSVSFVDSGVIHEGDDYELQKGDPVVCWMRPNLTTPNRGATPVLASYCLVVFKDGGKRLEVMDGSDLHKIEQSMLSQNKDKSTPAWKNWPDEMKRKAPIKRIAKTCDLGPLVAKAIAMDDATLRALPSSQPKKIMLADGATLPTLPRHEAPPEPAGQDGAETADETDPNNYATGPELFA